MVSIYKVTSLVSWGKIVEELELVSFMWIISRQKTSGTLSVENWIENRGSEYL